MKYRADIDGLRAIAVLAVMFFHFGLGASGGYVGVDIFFVISGFLIAGSSLRDLRSLTDVGFFFRRRIARIVPMAALTCLTCAAIAPLVYSQRALRDVMAAALPSAFFAGNFHFWQTQDYFSSGVSLNPFLHLWSLAIEEQFYILVPFLLLWTRRPKLFIALVALASIIIMTCVRPATAFYLLPARVWEFCVGIMLALIGPQRSRFMAGSSLAGACVILATVFLFPAGDLISPMWRLAPVLGTALIIWGGMKPNFFAEKVLGNAALSALGRLSFSAYLIHWPVWAFLNYKHPLSTGSPIAGLYVLVVLCAAFVTYLAIERPAQNYLRAQTLKKTAVLGVSLVGAAALTVVLPTSRSGDTTPGTLLQNFSDLYELGHCFLNVDQPPEQYDVGACDALLASGRPKIMVWGDSMAAHLIPGLKQNELLKNRSIFQARAATCSPLAARTQTPWCLSFNHFVMHKILPRSNPDVVILASKWVRDYEALGEVGLTRALEKRFRILARRGISVMLIGQGPNFSQDFSELKSVPAAGILYYPARDFSTLNSLLRSVAAQNNVAFIDPTAGLCGPKECMQIENGVPLFWDYAHMTAAGSRRLGRSLASEIVELTAKPAKNP